MNRRTFGTGQHPSPASQSRRDRRRLRGLQSLKAEGLEERALLSTVVFGPQPESAPFRAAASAPGLQAPEVADLGPLATLYDRQVLGRKAPGAVGGLTAADPADYLSFDAAGRVGVELRSENFDALAPALDAAGFRLAGRAPSDPIVEGYLPVAQLPALQRLVDLGVARVSPMYQPITNATANQADVVQESSRVRNTPAVGRTGAGTAVLIISDSFDRKGGYAADQLSGDLPAGVVVVDESTRPIGDLVDEGRAMAQLVFDIAPGAKLYFHSADNQTTLADYLDSSDGDGFAVDAAAAGITRLVAVDDINFFNTPFFQNSLVGKAVNAAATDAVHSQVSYFSSAGNHSNKSFEIAAPQFGGDLSLLDFDASAGTDRRQRLTIAAQSSATIVLQWANPWGAADNDLDFYVLVGADEASAVRHPTLKSETNNITTGNPIESISIVNPNAGPVTFWLEIQRNRDNEDSGKTFTADIKYVAFGNTITVDEQATNSPTIVGHNAAEGALAVGAAPFFDHSTPESFTSVGPTRFLFNDSNAPIAPLIRQTPGITGVDGSSTTVAGFGNFFGTSAAAPNVAAVAALMLEGDALSPPQVFAQLTSTANDISTPGFDNLTGAGMVDAFDAVYFKSADPDFPIAGEAVTPASIASPFGDGFESGALGLAWETRSNGGGRIQAQTVAGTTGGAKALTLDSFGVGNAPFSLNEAILHFDATTAPAGHPIYLSFDQREATGGDEDDVMPAMFAGSSNSDGVALSVDGVNWFSLVSLTGDNSSGVWKKNVFDLSAFATLNGLTLGADVRVKFQQFDNASLELDGMLFDQISVGNFVSTTTAGDLKVNPNEAQAPAQRSRVTEVSIDVTGTVNANPLSAFTLTRLQNNASISLVLKSITDIGGGKKRVLLGFTGAGTESGSVMDGDYKLTVSGLTDANGLPVDTNGDGTPGGPDLTLDFHRFFGDRDGDRDVDALDMGAFVRSHTGQLASPFLAFFDFNNSGAAAAGARHDAIDLGQFLMRISKKLAPPGP